MAEPAESKSHEYRYLCLRWRTVTSGTTSEANFEPLQWYTTRTVSKKTRTPICKSQLGLGTGTWRPIAEFQHNPGKEMQGDARRGSATMCAQLSRLCYQQFSSDLLDLDDFVTARAEVNSSLRVDKFSCWIFLSKHRHS